MNELSLDQDRYTQIIATVQETVNMASDVRLTLSTKLYCFALSHHKNLPDSNFISNFYF